MTQPATTGSGSLKQDDYELGCYLRALRAGRWTVAVHNDFRLNDEPYTFWLFTHPDGRWIKGEGTSDLVAVRSANLSRHNI